MRRPRDALADDVRTQQLWLSLQQRPWRSLAVVAAGQEIETIAVAHRLARVASWYTGQSSLVFDMRNVTLRLLDQQLHEMTSNVHNAHRVFLALRAVPQNPATVLIAHAADAAILCVALGKTRERDALQTLDAIGREWFIGTMLVPAGTSGEAEAPLGDDMSRQDREK
jgi:hypothetical protein